MWPVVIAFAIAAGCLGIAFLARTHARRRAQQAAAWPTARGVVTSTDIVPCNNGYLPWITYNYQVAGEPREGDRLRLGGRVMFRSRDKAEAYLKGFPSDGTVTVYYDPKSAGLALLDPSPQSYTFRVFAILAAMAALAGVTVMLMNLSAAG